IALRSQISQSGPFGPSTRIASFDRTSRIAAETSAGGAAENFSAVYAPAAPANRSGAAAPHPAITVHSANARATARLFDLFIADLSDRQNPPVGQASACL